MEAETERENQESDRELLQPRLEDSDVLNKKEIIRAFEEQEVMYLDQIVGWSKAPPDEEMLRTLKIHSLGEKLALRSLVEEAQRSRINMLMKNVRNPKKKNAQAMQKVTKSKRNVQLGWLHATGESASYTQVRLKQGGGTRNVAFPLQAGYNDIKRKLSDLFFPNGKSSSHGQLSDMTVGLAKFDHTEIKPNLDNGKPFTIKEYQRVTGLSVLRLYLTTRPKMIASDSDDDSTISEIISLGPHSPGPNPGISFEETVIGVPCDFSTPLAGPDSPSVPDCLLEQDPSVSFTAIGSEVEVTTRTAADLPLGRSHSPNLLDYLHANELPNITPSTPSGTHESKNLTISRGNVFWQMLDAFKSEGITSADIKFSFLNEKGVDTGGVSRDVYGAFWSQFFEVSALGENERVPCIRSDMGVEHWTAVGRIIVKGYKDVGFFPLRLCKAFVFAVLFGVESVKQDVLLSSFNQYISYNEASVLDKALSDFDHLSDDGKDDLIDILQRFEVRCLPKTCSNLNEILIGVCHKEIIQRPKYILDCLAYACKELLQHAHFRNSSNTDKFFDSIRPSIKKVLKLIQCTPQNASEMTTYGYLKQYLNSMDDEKLCLFLRFCTGSDCLCFEKIDVNFVHLSGLARRPVARTCGPTLDLPFTYFNYAEFRAEFNRILSSEEDWEMHYC